MQKRTHAKMRVTKKKSISIFDQFKFRKYSADFILFHFIGAPMYMDRNLIGIASDDECSEGTLTFSMKFCFSQFQR